MHYFCFLMTATSVTLVMLVESSSKIVLLAKSSKHAKDSKRTTNKNTDRNLVQCNTEPIFG